MMKKLIMVCLVFISFTRQSVYSQKKLDFGVKIGVQSPKFWNGSILDNFFTKKDIKVRPIIGGFSKYHLNRFVFLEYDIDLSIEGGGFKKNWTNITSVKNSLLFGLSTNTDKKNSFNLKLGYSHNLLLRASMDNKYINSKTNVSDYFKTSSHSIPFALGYVRKHNEYTLGLNCHFQILSGQLNTQDLILYGQTLTRFELKIAKSIQTKKRK